MDIERDKDVERQKIILSKLEKYEHLDNYAEPTDDFLSRLKNSKINDLIDNRQIFQLFESDVDYFVTEDRGIHSKSQLLGLDSSVLDILKSYCFLRINLQ